MTKKKQKQMIKEICDYFCDNIMEYCNLVGYEVGTYIDVGSKSCDTFSIKLNYPYRAITLWIEKGGIEMWQEKNWHDIRRCLFHEAFHILHWKYNKMSHQRFITDEQLDEEEEQLAEKFSFIINKLVKKISEK